MASIFINPFQLSVLRVVLNAGTSSVFYPVRGAVYFVRHPILWGNLIMLFGPQMALTVFIFGLCYVFLYPPQAILAFILNGPTGVVGAWIGMIQQAMAITRGISELFLFPRPLRILFDGVLVQEGADKLVINGRLKKIEVDETDHEKVMAFVKSVPGKVIWPVWFARLLLRMFLTFIPILGPLALILLDAIPTAMRCHGRYFELKNWDKTQIKYHVRQNRLKYFAFGFVAAALETFPIFGFVFLFFNTAGGALWAIDIELAQVEPTVTSTPRKRKRTGLNFSRIIRHGAADALEATAVGEAMSGAVSTAIGALTGVDIAT